VRNFVADGRPFWTGCGHAGNLRIKLLQQMVEASPTAQCWANLPLRAPARLNCARVDRPWTEPACDQTFLFRPLLDRRYSCCSEPALMRAPAAAAQTS